MTCRSNPPNPYKDGHPDDCDESPYGLHDWLKEDDTTCQQKPEPYLMCNYCGATKQEK